MKKLIAGNFSSVPMAELITATLDVAEEDEVRDDTAEKAGKSTVT